MILTYNMILYTDILSESMLYDDSKKKKKEGQIVRKKEKMRSFFKEEENWYIFLKDVLEETDFDLFQRDE